MKQAQKKTSPTPSRRAFPLPGTTVAIVAVVLAILFVFRALDTGSLLQYAVALVLVCGGLNYLGHHFVLLIKHTR